MHSYKNTKYNIIVVSVNLRKTWMQIKLNDMETDLKNSRVPKIISAITDSSLL